MNSASKAERASSGVASPRGCPSGRTSSPGAIEVARVRRLLRGMRARDRLRALERADVSKWAHWLQAWSERAALAADAPRTRRRRGRAPARRSACSGTRRPCSDRCRARGARRRRRAAAAVRTDVCPRIRGPESWYPRCRYFRSSPTECASILRVPYRRIRARLNARPDRALRRTRFYIRAWASGPKKRSSSGVRARPAARGGSRGGRRASSRSRSRRSPPRRHTRFAAGPTPSRAGSTDAIEECRKAIATDPALRQPVQRHRLLPVEQGAWRGCDPLVRAGEEGHPLRPEALSVPEPGPAPRLRAAS